MSVTVPLLLSSFLVCSYSCSSWLPVFLTYLLLFRSCLPSLSFSVFLFFSINSPPPPVSSPFSRVVFLPFFYCSLFTSFYCLLFCFFFAFFFFICDLLLLLRCILSLFCWFFFYAKVSLDIVICYLYYAIYLSQFKPHYPAYNLLS